MKHKYIFPFALISSLSLVALTSCSTQSETEVVLNLFKTNDQTNSTSCTKDEYFQKWVDSNSKNIEGTTAINYYLEYAIFSKYIFNSSLVDNQLSFSEPVIKLINNDLLTPQFKATNIEVDLTNNVFSFDYTGYLLLIVNKDLSLNSSSSLWPDTISLKQNDFVQITYQFSNLQLSKDDINVSQQNGNYFENFDTSKYYGDTLGMVDIYKDGKAYGGLNIGNTFNASDYNNVKNIFNNIE